MANKLTMKAVQNEYNKYNETTTADFDIDGKTYVVTVHPFFKPQRVSDLLERLKKDMADISKSKIELLDRDIPIFVLYHCVAEFTDFPISQSKDIEKRMAYFTQVVNTHYFKAVADKFIQSEVNEVWNRIIEVMATNEKINNAVNKAKAEVANLDIKSPELRERIQGKKKRIPEA